MLGSQHLSATVFLLICIYMYIGVLFVHLMKLVAAERKQTQLEL